MRVMKIVLVSVGTKSSHKYAKSMSEFRIVTCEHNQNGYKNEKGVQIHWVSGDVNSYSTGPRSAFAREKAAAEEKMNELLGSAYGMPAEILNDYLIEKGW